MPFFFKSLFNASLVLRGSFLLCRSKQPMFFGVVFFVCPYFPMRWGETDPVSCFNVMTRLTVARLTPTTVAISTRLSCVFVQSYDLRTFPGCHVHLDYFTVYSRYTVSQIWYNVVADNTTKSHSKKLQPPHVAILCSICSISGSSSWHWYIKTVNFSSIFDHIQIYATFMFHYYVASYSQNDI